VRQAAHCWHVPGGLVRGWRQWEVGLCGETAAICPVTPGGCSNSGGLRASLLQPWVAVPLLQAAKKSEMSSESQKMEIVFLVPPPKSCLSSINP
jgi:hypothetical protein